MRVVGVVVLDVLLKHCREVARSSDQEMVEVFAAQGADEAFGDRVRPRCSDWGADDADVGAGEYGVEGRGEFAVSIADQESNRSAQSPRLIRRLRACWVIQAPVGWAVIPARCTRRWPCSITSRM